MKTTFACPGCGASGSADAALEGREVRCRQCGHRFPIPGPGGPDPDGYALDEPDPLATSRPVASRPIDDRAVFVPTRSSEPTVATSPRKGKRRPSKKKARRDSPEIAWGTWLLRVGVGGTILLILIALIAPGGVAIVGWTLLGLGSAMVLIGYAAGAVGAFSEDSLYGCLYLILPLYNAYYLVTRWDDLWRWFLCSTAGVGLVICGTEMLRWAGVTE
jgi:hypothetical protein